MTNRKSKHRLRGEKLELTGMFRINGTTDPDNFRDGNTGDIESVTRESAGLFTVKLRDIPGFVLPSKWVKEFAYLNQGVDPTVWSKAHVVVDSYSQTDRTFQIQVLKATAANDTADAASDADDDDLVGFELAGCVDSIGIDNVT